MLPGVERSIMTISESMPRLIYSIEKLTKALDSPQERKAKGDIFLSIGLTAEEWLEVANAVANAVDLRHRQIEEDEPPDIDMNEEQIRHWADTLLHAYQKITKVLDTNHIIY